MNRRSSPHLTLRALATLGAVGLATTTGLAVSLITGSPRAALAATEVEQDPWQVLTGVDIREEESEIEWKAIKTFSPMLEGLDGERFTISGYAIPIDLGATIRNFLLVSDPDDCPFCGSSGYGPVLEVTLINGIPEMPEFDQLTVEGTLILNRDTDTYQTFRLEDGVLRKP